MALANQQDDLDNVLEKIDEIVKKSATGDYIYRGETSHHQGKPYYGKVSSGLYRAYPDIEAEHFDIETVQKEILREAREYGFQKMEALELTATLQHYGDKTNLIDFTTDCLVALFLLVMVSRKNQAGLSYSQESLKTTKSKNRPERFGVPSCRRVSLFRHLKGL